MQTQQNTSYRIDEKSLRSQKWKWQLGKNCFWVAQQIGEKTHDFWVLVEFVFAQVKPIEVSENQIVVRELFFPVHHCRFSMQNVFPQTQNLHLDVSASCVLV